MGLRIVLDPVGDNAVGEAKMTSETERDFLMSRRSGKESVGMY